MDKLNKQLEQIGQLLDRCVSLKPQSTLITAELFGRVIGIWRRNSGETDPDIILCNNQLRDLIVAKTSELLHNILSSSDPDKENLIKLQKAIRACICSSKESPPLPSFIEDHETGSIETIKIKFSLGGTQNDTISWQLTIREEPRDFSFKVAKNGELTVLGDVAGNLDAYITKLTAWSIFRLGLISSHEFLAATILVTCLFLTSRENALIPTERFIQAMGFVAHPRVLPSQLLLQEYVVAVCGQKQSVSLGPVIANFSWILLEETDSLPDDVTQEVDFKLMDSNIELTFGDKNGEAQLFYILKDNKLYHDREGVRITKADECIMKLFKVTRHVQENIEHIAGSALLVSLIKIFVHLQVIIGKERRNSAVRYICQELQQSINAKLVVVEPQGRAILAFVKIVLEHFSDLEEFRANKLPTIHHTLSRLKRDIEAVFDPNSLNIENLMKFKDIQSRFEEIRKTCAESERVYRNAMRSHAQFLQHLNSTDQQETEKHELKIKLYEKIREYKEEYSRLLAQEGANLSENIESIQQAINECHQALDQLNHGD